MQSQVAALAPQFKQAANTIAAVRAQMKTLECHRTIAQVVQAAATMATVQAQIQAQMKTPEFPANDDPGRSSY